MRMGVASLVLCAIVVTLFLVARKLSRDSENAHAAQAAIEADKQDAAIHGNYCGLDPDTLLKRRIVLLRGPITDAVADVIIAKLLFLRHQDPNAPVKIVIDSPGGSVTAGFGITDAMDHVKLPVATHCCGHADAMAALILAHGAPGQRTANAQAAISLSKLWSKSSPDAPNADRMTAELARLTEMVVQSVAKAAKRPPQDVARDQEHGMNFTCQAAIQYGLIDRQTEDTASAD